MKGMIAGSIIMLVGVFVGATLVNLKPTEVHNHA